MGKLIGRNDFLCPLSIYTKFLYSIKGVKPLSKTFFKCSDNRYILVSRWLWNPSSWVKNIVTKLVNCLPCEKVSAVRYFRYWPVMLHIYANEKSILRYILTKNEFCKVCPTLGLRLHQSHVGSKVNLQRPLEKKFLRFV